jgi:outer membrane scaffolding protein for murein synthesis (MipA/OmpV family)
MMINRTISLRSLFESCLVGLLFAALGAPSISLASGFASFFDIEDGINIVGAGVGKFPDYQGSDDYAAGIAPLGRYHFAGRRYVQLLGPDLRLNLNDSATLRFGPNILYRFGRDDDVDDAVVSRMEEIDDTVEVGAFISRVFELDPTDPRERFVTSADVKFDVGGTHNGWIATAGAFYLRPLGRLFVAHLGGRIAYTSGDYLQT